MKTVRIAFSDFWEGYKDDPNCRFYPLVKEILSERYVVEEVAADENPQYLFYSCFGEDFRFVAGNPVKIFFTGELFVPDFNECDYAFGYDRLSFGDRYMRLPLLRLAASLPAAKEKHERADEFFAKKTGFCSFVVSNGNAQQIRTEAFQALNAYKKVDSGGKFMNNVGSPVVDKNAFAAERKFSLCFENCVYSGYVTEKLTDAFAAGTVPIYLGSADIGKDVNPSAFINCYGMSVEEIVSAVKKVDSDDKLYLEMLSAPAFLSEADDFSDVAAFLYNVFDSPAEEAKRIPRGGQFITSHNNRRKAAAAYYRSTPKERLKADLKDILKKK